MSLYIGRHVYIYIHIHITYMHAYMCTYAYIEGYMYVGIHALAFMCVCMSVNTILYIHMYVIHICMNAYITMSYKYFM